MWHGPKRFSEGLAQLSAYMEGRGQEQGWLLMFCFNDGRERIGEEYTGKRSVAEGRTIYSIIV